MIKRFIAGAVCPSCAAIDTTLVYMHMGKEHLECVDCRYSDTMNANVSSDAVLPKTRVAKEEQAPDKEIDIIRVVE